MVPLFFFLLSLQRIWFRSSMDRMKDSGSFDWGFLLDYLLLFILI